MSECRWVGNDQPRMLRGRHGEMCRGEIVTESEDGPQYIVGCSGCQPCPEPHCLVQWHGERGDCETHAVTVCPSCVGKVREHLSSIVRLSALPLVEQAILGGDVESEAAHLLGPTANPQAWRQRGRHGHRYEPDSRIGEQHPEWVLGRFDLLVTEHLGHTRTQAVGIESSAAYLAANLNYLAADIEFDFADMADEIAGCCSHLEAVLHDGEQRDRGAPCMTCNVPLERTWGIESKSDGWRCPRCRQTSTEDQYRFAVAHLHREEATELTDRDMEIRTGIKAGTVRVWANRGHVKRRRDSGRTLYDVTDVLKLAKTRGLVS